MRGYKGFPSNLHMSIYVGSYVLGFIGCSVLVSGSSARTLPPESLRLVPSSSLVHPVVQSLLRGTGHDDSEQGFRQQSLPLSSPSTIFSFFQQPAVLQSTNSRHTPIRSGSLRSTTSSHTPTRLSRSPRETVTSTEVEEYRRT